MHGNGDPSDAQAGAEHELLARLERSHLALARWTAETRPCPSDVLALGAAVIFHGALERRWRASLNPVLDAAVTAQLETEHDRLAEDLELLDSIVEANPDSPDIGPLCAALLTRLREHVARDQRVLYRSAVGARPESPLA